MVYAAGRDGYQRGKFLINDEECFLLSSMLRSTNYALCSGAFVSLQMQLEVRRALNGVTAKSVDFVICDVLTLDPVAAIEVDDRSHLLPERQQRDAFVNAVFLEIGLPLMRVKARRAYSVDELRVMCARAGLFTLPRMEGANS